MKLFLREKNEIPAEKGKNANDKYITLKKKIIKKSMKSHKKVDEYCRGGMG